MAKAVASMAVIVFVSTALGASASAQTDACDAEGQKAADVARAKGLSAVQVERTYTAATLRCMGMKDEAMAAIAAAARLDYARLGRLFLAGKLGTAEYLQRVRNRSAKLRTARTSAAYRAAFRRGDTDGDLVPNDRDRCPGTPDLAATNAAGCPATGRLPRVPTDAAMRRAREAMRGSIAFVANPACADAPAPERPVLLHQGFLRPSANPATHFYGVAVSRVNNQPATCPVFYQFLFRFTQRVDPKVPSSRAIEVAFGDKDNKDSTPKAGVRRIFKVTQADKANRQQLFQASVKYGVVEWRVRAIGSNGLESGWSELRRESFNGVFNPDGQ